MHVVPSCCYVRVYICMESYLNCFAISLLKDHSEKQFLWRHSRTCFELLDGDGSNAISLEEFSGFGFIFNISKQAASEIFRDFDVDGSKELDYEEFQMFTLACLDKQAEIEAKKEWQQRVKDSCPIL